MDNYTEAIIREIHQWGGGLNGRPIDTVYFGGGTPSLLKHRLVSVMDEVKKSFNLVTDSEITLELNPASNSEELLEYAKKASVNRLSIGAQSGNDTMLKTLGRTHSADDTRQTVELARKFGFRNISLDIMIALPDSDEKSLKYDLEFIKSMSPEHISAYMLKIEEKTAFYAQKERLNLPDDDKSAEQYLMMCEFFENSGYEHYEISNFAKAYKHSRHNTKYWQGEEYLGLGPSAHSMLGGKRFYYPKDLKGFIDGNSPLPDGESGGIEEYIMLRLRLKKGIDLSEYKKLFGCEFQEDMLQKCRFFQKVGLMNIENNCIWLTDEGMLLSNSIITELLECEI